MTTDIIFFYKSKTHLLFNPTCLQNPFSVGFNLRPKITVGQKCSNYFAALRVVTVLLMLSVVDSSRAFVN